MSSNSKAPVIKAWCIVLASALFGCSISAAFPQFSLTISALSGSADIPVEILLISDTVKSVGIILSMFASGFAYRRLGVTPVFLYTLTATVLPQFVLPYTASIPLLMFLKLLQGSASLIFPVFLILIMERIPARQRGVATALFNGIFYAGGGAGGSIAGLITAKSGWIASYFLLGAIMAACGILWYAVLRLTRESGGTFPASFSHGAATKSLASDDRSAPQNRTFPGAKKHTGDPPDSILRRASHTCAAPKTKKNGLPAMTTALLSIGFFASTFTIQGVTVDMPVFAETMGHSAVDIAKASGWVTAAMVFGCLIAGKISDFMADRMEDKRIARLLAMLPGGLFIFAAMPFLTLGDAHELPLFCIVAFLLTFGGCWGLGAFYPVIPDIFDAESAPAATGIAGGVGDMGMPAAPLIIGVIFGAKGMWNLAWGSCLIIALISMAAILILILKERKTCRR